MKHENYINLSVTQEIGVTRLILNTTTCVKDVQSLLHLFVEANKFKYPRIEIAHKGYEGCAGYQTEITATISIGQVDDVHHLVRKLVSFIEDLEPDIKVYTNPIFDETKEQCDTPKKLT